MEFKPPFETWVKRRRIELDLSRPMLARKMGYAPETLRKMESGRLKPSAQMVALLAKHLAIPEAQRDDFYAFAAGSANDDDAAAGHLPIFATPLIGREADLAVLTQLLARDEVRLVTLAGPPGVGKTRLAVEAACQMQDHFSEGVRFVDLAEMREPHTALAVIAQVTGVLTNRNAPLLKSLQEGLREQQMLLVLDNLEQVLALGPMLAQILISAPRVKMLTTSREVLNISIEQAYALAPLANRNADAGDWHSPAVELFAQRARLVKPTFALDDNNGPIIAAICQKLDGLPLAIELAAARMAIFTPAEILTRLEKRLPVLAAGARDLPDRQRTLNATLDWSYTLLNNDEQALFRRLGVFAGGCTLQAAELFCDVDELTLDAEEGLTALASKHLIYRIDAAGGESRYAMLETIRAYALDQLKAHGELDDWHEHLADYLVSMRADAVSRRIYRADADNWRAAVAWAIATGHIGDAALPLLRVFHEFGIDWHERKRLLESILLQPHVDVHAAVHARALSMLGEAANMAGDLAQAVTYIERGVIVCRRHGLRAELIEMLFILGLTLRAMGETARARVALLECIDCCDQWGFAERIPHLLVTLAEVEVLDEDAETAIKLVDRAVEMGVGDSEFMRVWVPNHRAHALQLLGDLAGARTQVQHSIKLCRQYGITDNIIIVWNYSALAEIALSEMDLPAALQNAQKSLDVGDMSSVEKALLSWDIVVMAGVCARAGNPTRGATLWGIGESFREQVHSCIAPAARLNRERTVALLREQLGEAEFARLAGEGAKMSVDEAVAFALEESSRTP